MTLDIKLCELCGAVAGILSSYSERLELKSGQKHRIYGVKFIVASISLFNGIIPCNRPQQLPLFLFRIDYLRSTIRRYIIHMLNKVS
jgi:hypothetical protein